MQKLTLQIGGMSCGHCLNAVNQALTGQPGVTIRSVRMGRAELEYDATITGSEAIAALVTNAGYPATVQPAP